MLKIKSILPYSIFLILIILVLSLSIPHILFVSSQETQASPQQVNEASQTALSGILAAQSEGANVSSLVMEFNTGLSLEQGGNYSQAINVFQSVSSQSVALTTAAKNATEMNLIITYFLVLGVPAILGSLTFGTMTLYHRIKFDRIIQMRASPKVKDDEEENRHQSQ
jgi:hypothetical protein